MSGTGKPGQGPNQPKPGKGSGPNGKPGSSDRGGSGQGSRPGGRPGTGKPGR